MLPISIMGLVFNLIQMKILHHDEPETLADNFANDPNMRESLLDNE